MGKIIDLTGQKFGRLTVIERAANRGPRGVSAWCCRCDCGNERIVIRGNLRNKLRPTQSCGCFRIKITADKQSLESLYITQKLSLRETGEKLSVSSPTIRKWLDEYEIPRRTLREAKKLDGKKYFKHGAMGTSLYKSWSAMKHRCKDIKCKLYGAKGIKVCNEWQDFLTFRDWALLNGHVEGLVIDRIDSDKNYSPDNCQWITRGENSAKVAKDTKIKAFQAGFTYALMLIGSHKPRKTKLVSNEQYRLW